MAARLASEGEAWSKVGENWNECNEMNVSVYTEMKGRQMHSSLDYWDWNESTWGLGADYGLV